MWIFLKNAQFEKALMTFGDFWMGISKKPRNVVFLVQGGGVAFMGAWLSDENGQAVNVRKLVMLFLRKRHFFKMLRHQGENTLCFPIYQQSCENFLLHPFFGQGVHFV